MDKWCVAISVMLGCLYSVDWTRDWTVGLDCGTGLRESIQMTETTQEIAIQLPLTKYASFLVAAQLSFQCEFAHDHAL